MNNWQCSNASQIALAIKTLFVMFWNLTQKNLKQIRL